VTRVEVKTNTTAGTITGKVDGHLVAMAVQHTDFWHVASATHVTLPYLKAKNADDAREWVEHLTELAVPPAAGGVVAVRGNDLHSLYDTLCCTAGAPSLIRIWIDDHPRLPEFLAWLLRVGQEADEWEGAFPSYDRDPDGGHEMSAWAANLGFSVWKAYEALSGQSDDSPYVYLCTCKKVGPERIGGDHDD